MECDRPGIGGHLPGVIHRTFWKRHINAESPPIRAFGNQDLLSRVKPEATVRRGKRAVVLNLIGQHEKRTAGRSLYLSEIDDARYGWRTVILPKTAAPVGPRRERHGADNHATDIYHRIGAKIKTALVHEHHVTIRVEIAQ